LEVILVSKYEGVKGAVDVKLHLLLISVLDAVEWSDSRPGLLFPETTDPNSLQ